MPVQKEELLDINAKIDGPHPTVLFNIFGESFVMAEMLFPPEVAEFELAKKLGEISRQLLEEGKLKAPKTLLTVRAMAWRVC